MGATKVRDGVPENMPVLTRSPQGKGEVSQWLFPLNRARDRR
jgi:hypothetical protein